MNDAATCKQKNCLADGNNYLRQFQRTEIIKIVTQVVLLRLTAKCEAQISDGCYVNNISFSTSRYCLNEKKM